MCAINLLATSKLFRMRIRILPGLAQMSGAQRITQAERTEISDARMLESAIRLIVERGTEKTTLKDVGELAGYSRGLAGYRFGNRAGLFQFVMQRVAQQWLAELKQHVSGASGYAAIEAAVDAHYRVCAEAPSHFSAFYILWFESIGPQSQVKDVVAGIHQRRCRDVAQWVEAGIAAGNVDTSVEPERVAEQFCASIVGIVYQWLLQPNDLNGIETLYQQLKTNMKLVLSGDELLLPMQKAG